LVAKEGRKRAQRLLFEDPADPLQSLSPENRAVLAFFASELAGYLEGGLDVRLSEIEYKLEELRSSVELDDAKVLRDILALFSKYKMFRVLIALCRFSSSGKGFTKNALIRAAGVGQGFRAEGLDRLIEIFLRSGVLVEVGKRGRGTVYSVTPKGQRFLSVYVQSARPSFLSP